MKMRESRTVARSVVRGSGMPIGVERANPQKPHAEYAVRQVKALTRLTCHVIIHIHEASTVCYILDSN